MGFNWDEEEFRDMPEDDQVTPVFPNQQSQRPAAKAQPTVAELIEEVNVEQEEEDDYSVVLADANLRLEQGNLYKMIMNHDLFSGLDSDPRAISNVQREIKRFARERMEIMLGMRQDVSKVAVVASPFNELEVIILKKLASAASKGATEAPEANKEAPKAFRPTTLNSIGAQKPAQAPAPLAKKPQPKPAKPVQKSALPAEFEPMTKPLSEMTPDEQTQRYQEVAARQTGKRAKSSVALPMPSFEQQQMVLAQRAAESDQSNPAMSALVGLINQSRSK